MTIQELDKEISLRKVELEDKFNKEAFEYIKVFMESNNLENIVDFVYMNIWELIKCNMFLNCEEKDINKISESVDSFSDLFNRMTESSIEAILLVVEDYVKKETVDDLIRYFSAEGIINEITSFSKLSDTNEKTVISLMAYKKALREQGYDFVPFLEALKTYKEPFLKELKLYITHREVFEFIKGNVFAVSASRVGKKSRRDVENEVLTNALNNVVSVSNILTKMHTVKKFKEDYERIDKNNQRELNGLNASRASLEQELDKKQIVNYREIIKGLKSPKLKYLFLLYIKEHNEVYYEELEKELNELKQDSKISIKALLNDYGITEDSYDYDSLPKYTKEELETILKVLSTLVIPKEDKVRIIMSTSIEKINTVKDYLEREILSIDFVSSNISILNEESIELDNLKENIEVLKTYGIPVSVFSKSIRILMNESSFISNSLTILNTYGLINQLSETSNFKFLMNKDLERVIDKYLELGYEEYLSNDLDLLNKKELERLEVMKAIGISITSREELESILNEEKPFFIPKDEISNYLSDESIYVDEPSEQVSLEKLEQYKATDRVYDFNGVKISINKVNRFVSNGFSLYQAIIKNTHLSEEELLGIVKIINTNKGKELKRD